MTGRAGAGDPRDLEIARLRAEAEKYRLLIETTDTGYVILDGDGRVLDANDEYARLAGRGGRGEVLGRSVVEWTAAHDRERNAAEVRKCVEFGSVRHLEVDYRGADGRLTPVEVNATLLRGPGAPTILTICREISGRRRAEEALRDSEVRYRDTVDALSDMLHVVDAGLRLVLINQAGSEWLAALGIGDPLGRELFEVFPFLPDNVREQYRQVFASGRPLITEETSRVGGVEYATETRKIPIFEGGEVARVVTVVRDVTEAARAQERLRQAEKMEALGQLAGGIAHDFNNQLAAMLGYAELLGQRLADAQLRGYAEMIARSAAHAAELTRQLLAFSRKGRYRSVPVDVHDLVREVAALLGRTIDRRIAIRERLAAPVAVTIGDPAQLQNALLNLAINARDAMPDGGEIEFATEVVTLGAEECRRAASPIAPGRFLRVRVADTGAGMSEEVQRRLFEPFFTTKDPGRGTGMGLAAVYGTVLNNQGAIRVRSTPGAGSAFTIDLPLLEAGGADAAPGAEAPARGSAHVLLADDEVAVREMAAAALRHHGYRVTACADGAEALAYYREHAGEVDLAVLDVVMPNLGGHEALVAMRRLNPDLRCVLVSGYGADAARRILDDGATGFLPKPFHINDLFRKVAEALRG